MCIRDSLKISYNIGSKNIYTENLCWDWNNTKNQSWTKNETSLVFLVMPKIAREDLVLTFLVHSLQLGIRDSVFVIRDSKNGSTA